MKPGFFNNWRKANLRSRRGISVSKSVQVTFGPHIDLPIDYCGCGQDPTVEFVCGEDVQLLTSLQHNHHALDGCNVDPVVGSHGRGVVVAQGSQPFAVQQLACLRNSTENEPAVLESIKASVVVQG